MRRLLLISLLVVIPSYLSAQRLGFGHFTGRSAAGSGAHSGYAGHSPSSYYPAFLDPLYSDYLSSAAYTDSAPPPVIFLQPPPAAPAPEPPAEPLMIELQGNSYVQISGDQSSQGQLLDQSRLHELARKLSAPEIPPPLPTVLVFRDGHRLEVSDYTIADGFLYASSDYYRSGSWNQKIELAVLNLDETVSTNRSRGVTFRLPSAPNVVIVGP